MAEHYSLIKLLHITCAAISITGFLLRNLLAWQGSSLPNRRYVRRLVDGNDAILLTTAILMVILSGQYPWLVAWVAAKIGGLLLYIGLGIAAFRLRYKPARMAAGCMALLVAGYIVSVAISKNPAGFFALPG